MGFIIVDMNNVHDATGSASSEAAGFPATRIASKEGPYVRGWRSTGTGGATATVSFSSGTIKGIFLYDCNFSTATVGSAGSQSISADVYDSGNVERRKCCVLLNTSGSSQTITIPGQTPTDGAAYFKIGRIFVFSDYVELGQNPKPGMAISNTHPVFTAGDENSGVFEQVNGGPTFIHEEWDFEGSPENATDVYAASAVGSSRPFILFHNLGVSCEAYVMKRVGQMTAQKGNNIESIGMTFRQIA